MKKSYAILMIGVILFASGCYTSSEYSPSQTFYSFIKAVKNGDIQEIGKYLTHDARRYFFEKVNKKNSNFVNELKNRALKFEFSVVKSKKIDEDEVELTVERKNKSSNKVSVETLKFKLIDKEWKIHSLF